MGHCHERVKPDPARYRISNDYAHAPGLPSPTYGHPSRAELCYIEGAQSTSVHNNTTVVCTATRDPLMYHVPSTNHLGLTLFDVSQRFIT